jgi:hypothetical protein
MSEMTGELELQVMHILDKRVGVKNAIKRWELVKYLPGNNERKIRLAISNLRKSGELIGSTCDAGYFMCENLQEWQFVRDTEFIPRITDLAETVRILDKAARERFGEGFQPILLDS